MRVTRASVRIDAPWPLGDFRQRGGQRARAPADRDAAADRHRIGGDAADEHRAGTGRPRACRVAEDRVRRDGRAEHVRLEPLRRQIGHRHRHPAREPRQVLAPERSGVPAGGQEPPPVAPGQRIERRRRLPIDPRHQSRHALDRSRELDPAAGVGGRERIDRRRGEDAVAMEHQRASIATERGQRRIGRQEFETRAIESQRAHDIPADRSERMAERRRAVPRRELRRDRRATRDRLPIQHDHRQLLFREQRARDQAVQPRANDDDVRHATRSPSTRMAALRPFAAMMPPPGCVADPHRYSRRIGVR